MSADRDLPTYVIGGASSRERPAVQLWSHDRLPYEPKGESRAMRDDLRSALSFLEPQDGHVLYGCYTSDVRDYACDAENVLFYNVKDPGFPNLCTRGLMFERAFQPPSLPPSPMTTARHHHYYEMRRAYQELRCWTRTRTISSWQGVEIEPLASGLKPAAVWRTMKMAALGDAPGTHQSAIFGLRVTVGVPTLAHFNIASVVKPLLDGIICGLHVHDGQNLDDVSVWLSRQLDTTPAIISQLLMSEWGAVLGKRRLLHARRNGVQWNPADDRCVAAEVLVTGSATSWQLSGDIFEVEERRA